MMRALRFPFMIVILTFGIFSNVTRVQPAVLIESQNCIDSFHHFAYEIPLPFRAAETLLSPAAPWQQVGIIPPHHVSGYGITIHQLDVIATRELSGKKEVWLRGIIFSNEPTLRPRFVLIRYDETDRSWEYISSASGIPNLYIWNIFVSSDGTIWGDVDWDYYFSGNEISPNAVPVLSRFNEESNLFEIPEGMVYAPPPTDLNDFDDTLIALDQTGVFWIFNVDDVIYRYDTIKGVSEIYEVDINDDVRDVTFSPNGKIYLATATIGSGQHYALYEFSPESQRLMPIDLPNDDWKTFNGILVDGNRRLWIGANGYRDINQDWHLLQASPDEAGYELSWAPATPILASSDGRIWYNRFLDTSGWAEGAAWYDPETNQGCWVTHFPANVVEDQQQRLWLAADGSLYSLDLSASWSGLTP